MVIATGVRSRPWPVAEEAALDGVISVRTSDDAARLHALLAEKPRRVLVIGGGFTGSEVASVCRQLGLDVTLVERGTTPLAGALGDVIGEIAADLQRAHGVDLHTGVEVGALEGDGRIRQVTLVGWNTTRCGRGGGRARLGPQCRVAAKVHGWRPDRSECRPTPVAAP